MKTNNLINTVIVYKYKIDCNNQRTICQFVDNVLIRFLSRRRGILCEEMNDTIKCDKIFWKCFHMHMNYFTCHIHLALNRSIVWKIFFVELLFVLPNDSDLCAIFINPYRWFVTKNRLKWSHDRVNFILGGFYDRIMSDDRVNGMNSNVFSSIRKRQPAFLSCTCFSLRRFPWKSLF